MSTVFVSPNWRMPRNANQSKSANYSLNFDGSNYVDAGTDSVNGALSLQRNFTISFWFFTSSFATTNHIISREDTSTYGWRVQFDSANIALRANSTTQATKYETPIPSTNQWHHLVFTYDGGTNPLCYIDGQSVTLTQGFGTWFAPPNNSYNFRIGKPDSYGGFDGKLGQVSIFDYALSASQVTTLYGDSTNGSGNPMALLNPPKAYYPLGTSAWNGNFLAENNAIGDYVFDFDGYPDIINVGNILSLQAATTFTVSAWVKRTRTGHDRIFGSWDASASKRIIGFAFNSNDTLLLQLSDDGTNMSFAYSTNTITDTNWHHVLVTYNAGTVLFYIDGDQDTTTGSAVSSLANISSTYHIGALSTGDNTARFFVGDISNVQVFSTALSATDAETLYNYGSPIQTLANIPQSSNLKAWYKLDASDVYDSSTTEWNNIEARANNKGSMLCGYNSWSGNALLQSYNSPVERSISIWVRRTASMGYHGCCNQQGTGGAQSYSQFFVWSNRGYIFSFFVPSPNKFVDFGYMAPETWYHAVLTDTGVTAAGRFKTYWNGEFANASTDLTYDLGTPTSGFKWAGRNFLFAGGSIADGRLFDTVLSASEVQTLYNNGAPSTLNNVKPNNLKQWLTFENIDTSVGGGLYDKSGNDNQVTTPLYPWVAAKAAENLNVPISSLNGLSSGMSQSNLVQSDLQTVAPYSKYAIEFDHADSDYIDLTSDINLGSTMSFSVWLKTDHVNDPSDPQNIRVKNITGGDGFFNFNEMFGMGLTNGRLSNYVGNTSGATGFALSTNPLNDNIWHHCFLTFDGSTLRSYIDGSLNVTIEGITTWTNNIIKTIGRYDSSAIRYFDGILSNMAVWNSALTASQAKEIYNEGLPSDLNTFSGPAPTAWWQLGEGSSYAGGWIFADEIGSINGEGQNLTEINLVNGVGTTANGVSSGMGVGALVSDAPYSTGNAMSVNMAATARGTNVP